MSAQDAFENKVLSLYFQNAGAANIGDATGLPAAATAGSLYVSLHTAAPADSATSQATSESAYTSYARVAVARSSGVGWDVASGVASNKAATTFPACTGSTSTITNFGLGFASTSTGSLDVVGTASLAVSTGITPSFAIGALQVSLD